jgi:hypothetical protein
MGFMMKAAARAAAGIGRGSRKAAERRIAASAASIQYWARVAADRAIRAFCINPENKNDQQCVQLAQEDAVREELKQQLAEKDAAFVEGCKATPYDGACIQRVGLPPIWQMIYDFCGWVCGLIWSIGSWFASISPFSWALIILGIILFFVCVGAVADDEPPRRRSRGWGPHLD